MALYPLTPKDDRRTGYDMKHTMGFHKRDAPGKPARNTIRNVEPPLHHTSSWLSILEDVINASAESNSYRAIEKLCSLVRSVTEIASPFHPNDYSIFSGKGDTSIDDVAAYSMRDAVQWWTHWHGSLVDHHWKHIYMAFSTVSEDVAIPPQHLLDGRFRILGNSFDDMSHGLRKEKVSSENVAFMEKCLLRQYLVQYLDKKVSFSTKFQFDAERLSKWRDIMANTHGSTMALLTADKSESFGRIGTAIQMTTMMDSLSMELATHSLAISASEFQDARQCSESEFRQVYFNYMKLLRMLPTAPLLGRSATSGLHVVPRMDGAREARKQVRFPMSQSILSKIHSYIQPEY